MKKRNIILLAVIGTFFFTSCTSVYRATYTTENVRGQATIDNRNMLADYEKFVIQYSPYGDVTIINKTDSTMFIDMAESYYVGNGVAERLYSNSVTTNYSSETSGATVNLGSITNALGIRGVAGTIAQGVNVGSSNTNGSSVQLFEERYISIPPLSQKSVKSVLFSDAHIKANNLQMNGIFKYDRNNSFSNEYIFSYTFDPNASGFLSTRDLIYISEIEKKNHIGVYKAKKFLRKSYNKNEVIADAFTEIDGLYTALTTLGVLTPFFVIGLVLGI